MAVSARFFDEYCALSERFDWAARRMEDDDVVQCKLTLADLRSFVDRWQGKTGNAEVEDTTAEIAKAAKGFEVVVARKHAEEIMAVLDARRAWLREQAVSDASVKYLRLVQLAPAALRPELERMFRQYQGYDFDGERFYRDCEADLEECEKGYRKGLANMDANWPEDAATHDRQRLDSASLPEIDQWRGQLAAVLGSSAAGRD